MSEKGLGFVGKTRQILTIPRPKRVPWPNGGITRDGTFLRDVQDNQGWYLMVFRPKINK